MPSLRKSSLSKNMMQKLESVLYREMYEYKVGTFEELWQLHNSDELEYIPYIHFVIVTDSHNQQYIFRENEDRTEIFGLKIKLIKLNKERMGID